MDEMGVAAINPLRYGRLLARNQPKVIESDKELDAMIERLERLDFAAKTLTVEERALQRLLATLIEDYDSRKHALPRLEPRRMILFLLEQRGLDKSDLEPVFGSGMAVSAVLNGKREISTNQVRQLAEFFGVSAELFI